MRGKKCDKKKNEVIIQDNKEITSDIMLEEIICKAIQIPGVKVDMLENIINNGPIGVGITREEIKKYKELLDSGIINQEEFNKKKKDLLNL